VTAGRKALPTTHTRYDRDVRAPPINSFPLASHHYGVGETSGALTRELKLLSLPRKSTQLKKESNMVKEDRGHSIIALKTTNALGTKAKELLIGLMKGVGAFYLLGIGKDVKPFPFILPKSAVTNVKGGKI